MKIQRLAELAAAVSLNTAGAITAKTAIAVSAGFVAVAAPTCHVAAAVFGLATDVLLASLSFRSLG